MTVFMYSRVSTAKQAEKGDSVGEQVENLARQAQNLYPDHDHFSYVESGVSGGIPLDGRPKGSDMLNVLKSGDIILTSRLDRLFRNTIDGLLVAQEIYELGVIIHPLDMGPINLTTSMGRLQYSNALAMAQYELDRSIERTSTVKRHQRDSGAYMGGSVPFGKTVVETAGKRQLVDSEEDLAMLNIIKESLAKGMSCRDIEEKLAREYQYFISYRTVSRLSKQITAQD